MSHTQGGRENHWFLTWVSELTGNVIPSHFHHVIPIHIIIPGYLQILLFPSQFEYLFVIPPISFPLELMSE